MSPVPIVHQGADGWLFLRGGSNFVADLYNRSDAGKLSDRALENWRRLIETRTWRCRQRGILCLHVVIPDKLTIYGDRQGELFVDPDLSPALRLAQMMAGSDAQAGYLDLVGPMRAAKAQQPLYWRTDSHWTPAGCFLAYQAICRRLGLKAEEDLLARPRRAYTAVMDLGAHLPSPPWEDVVVYDYAAKARRVWTNAIARCLEDPIYREEIHVGARARFDNPTARNRQHIILFGDSYAKSNTSALTGMMAETVDDLEFVWRAAISWPLIRKRRPDVVLVAIAERFLRHLPNDASPLALWEGRQLLKAWRLRRSRRQGAVR